MTMANHNTEWFDSVDLTKSDQRLSASLLPSMRATRDKSSGPSKLGNTLFRRTATARKFIALVLICFLVIFYLFWMSSANYAFQTYIGNSTEWGSAASHDVNETHIICSENFADRRLYINNRSKKDYKDLPVIYFVTPTYPRREQIAELTRLSYTLLHVPRIHWILANDYSSCSIVLEVMLNKLEIPFTHLSSPMPAYYRHLRNKPRGVSNRRAALLWLRQRNITNGILYFGDDDNTYDLKLFSEIRNTRRVSMFPVGLISGHSVSGPVVRKGKVVGFLETWVSDRRWPVDMAGFAVNLNYMAKFPNASMPYIAGSEEDFFLRSIGLKLDYVEPVGNNATEVLVWHTQTKSLEAPTILIKHEYLDDRSNLGKLLKTLEEWGVTNVSNEKGLSARISVNGKLKPLSYFFR